MNPRERMLAILLVSLILIGVIGFGVFGIYLPSMRAKDREFSDLAGKRETKELQVLAMLKSKKELDEWRQISLPGGDVHMAWSEYERWLTDLEAKASFAPGALKLGSKQPDESSKTAPLAGQHK